MENMQYTDRSELMDVSALNMHDTVIRNGGTEEEALAVVSALSRDNARTPMQWNDSEQAGFTTGIPWQRVNPNYTRINVQQQEKDPSSILNFYRKMGQLHKDPQYNSTFAAGTFTPYSAGQKDLIAYERKGEKELLVLANAGNTEQTVELPDGTFKVLLNNVSDISFITEGILLEPYQFVILEKTE